MNFDELIKKYTEELILAQKMSKTEETPTEIANEIVDEVVAPVAQAMPSEVEDMSGTGYLKVITRSGENAFPEPDVFVRITYADQNGDVNFISSGTTNQNGETEIFSLPAKPEFLSLSPSTDNSKPFVRYNIESYKDGYFTIINKNVPIFDKQTAIQNIEMIPLPLNFSGDKTITYEENENPSL